MNRVLSAQWRERAEYLRRYGDGGVAAVWEQAAHEIEAAVRKSDEALLTLGEAAAESGFSADHLGRLVRHGKISNAGRKGAPRIRRRDLPRRAGGEDGRAAKAGPAAYTGDRLFRDIINSKKKER